MKLTSFATSSCHSGMSCVAGIHLVNAEVVDQSLLEDAHTLSPKTCALINDLIQSIVNELGY